MPQRSAIGVVILAITAIVAPWALIQPVLSLIDDLPNTAAVLAITVKVSQLLPVLAFAHLVAVAAGAYLALQLSVRPATPEKNRPADALTVQLEELRRTNAQLLRLQTELVAADRLATVGKLASGVAHEVGNPLAGILGYAGVLRGKVPPDVRPMVDQIEAEVQRIDAIVRSLLELGRPSRGGREAFELRPLLDAAIGLLSASSEFVEVTTVVEAPTGLHVLGEPGPLSQAVVNLLLNAAQAMQSKGTIRVVVECSATHARIHVDDSGPGVPPELLPQLFTLFFTTKAPGKGTGLGLAMSRHLLMQFDATLTGENRAAGGARFTITIPLA